MMAGGVIQMLSPQPGGLARKESPDNKASYAFGGAFFPLDKYTNPDRVETASMDGAVYEKSRSYGHALTLTAEIGDATLKSISANSRTRSVTCLTTTGSSIAA